MARKTNGDYVINGSKMWITNGAQADFCCLLANTSDGPSHRNKSLIMVPMKIPGVSVAKKIRKIGMNASDTAQLHFDDVRVPQRNRIGEEGMGFVYQWGGMGYAAESSISRIFRDGRLSSIGGGADEVMLQILCKYMSILPTR